ncbi:MAG: serine/threonine protein kinase [Planctomycetes bacterium]|nr:serine/threonine protein kinase [Planctomycetota bacterium]
MTSASADRNLLFGVLAVQLDFVSRDELIAATSRWVLDKQQPLSDMFVQQGMLSAEESQLLDSLVDKHLDRNGGDPRQSLQSIEAFEAIRSTLGNLEDADLRATVEFETLATPANDPYSTHATSRSESVDTSNRFTILRLHQKGGLGSVSIALDEELNREIALKEILPAHADSEENRTRFVREAEITGALEHPGVVPVYSLGQFADGRPYYAMRFIRGVNLQIALEDYHRDKTSPAEKQLRFRQLLSRFIDVCNAMEYAHSRGVIHRDLKPGNIMLGEYGETLVVDWGLAKSLGDGFQTDVTLAPPVHPTPRASSTETQIGRVVGTPTYMSPEQAAGRLDALGACSDIYSLGATLYHLLTGQVAFSGSEEEVLGNVQMGRFARPRTVNPKVPRALEAICLKAMARMPRDRYSSGRELADDIERYLADERVLAYDEPFPVKAWRWVRNHKPLVISTAAALTVAVAALSVTVITLRAANVRVIASRDEARHSYTEAEKQREIAEKSRGWARDTVREYCVLVSEETLLKQPGMHRLREELLQKALAYYQHFLDEREKDPTLREEVAQAYYFIGKITREIDSPANAVPYYERSVELHKQLLTDSPDDRALLAGYGTTLNAIGDSMLRLGNIDEARQFFEQAAEVRQKVAKANPGDDEAARKLANSVMNTGYVQPDIDEAIALMKHAQVIRMARVAQSETVNPKLQSDLGKGYYALAVTSSKKGDLVYSEANFLQAIEIFSKLLEDSPNNLTHQRGLAACRRMVGDLKSQADEPTQAIEYYQTARKALEKLRMRSPDVLEYSSDLAGVYINLGRELEGQRQPELALQHRQQAVELLRELSEQAPKVPSYRLDLGIALRAVGNLQAEAGLVDEARRLLLESRLTLAKLVSEDPSDELYAEEMGLTIDALAALEVSEAAESDSILP